MAKVPNGIETLPKISIASLGCTNVTDDRQTDGRTTTYSEREKNIRRSAWPVPARNAKCNVVAQEIDHNERTVPIIIWRDALRMHETAIFLKCDVTIIFFDPDFLSDPRNSAIRVHLRQIFEYLIFAWVSGPLGLNWVLRGKIEAGVKISASHHNANRNFWLDGFLWHSLVGIF